VSIHQLVGLFAKIPAFVWIGLAVVLMGWVPVKFRQLLRRSRASEAESWPVSEGAVQNVDVQPFSNQDQLNLGCDATVVYSYSVLAGAETEYYSGEYRRTFSSEGSAWDWLRTLQNKRIPVHYNPRRPKISAVREEELDRIFPLPPRFVENSARLSPGLGPSAPEMHWITDLGAWIAAGAFLFALANHIDFLVTGRELNPRLGPVLWILLLGAGVPFAFWYKGRTGLKLWGKPQNWSHVPQWIRAFVLLLNAYIPLHWLVGLIVDAFHSAVLGQRLNPFENGAFLAAMWGDAAAILYSHAAQYENPYRISDSIEPE